MAAKGRDEEAGFWENSLIDWTVRNDFKAALQGCWVPGLVGVGLLLTKTENKFCHLLISLLLLLNS